MSKARDEDFEDLLARSSLGTYGAKMLIARTSQALAENVSRLSGRLRVLVTGGDGYCGWPTSLYLSDRGHDVTIVDDLSRRRIDAELGQQSLTPIRSIGERLEAWKEVSGRRMGFVELDLATEYDRLAAVLREFMPDAMVHFAASGRRPTRCGRLKKRYTVDNNVRATHNLLVAMVATGSTAALAHLGTMGVYGYGWSGRADSRGVPDGEGADAGRRPGAGDPASGEPGVGVSHDQDAGSADVRVLRQERRAADH